MVKIETVITGLLGENAYIVYDDEAREAVVIDPGADDAEIAARMKQLGVVPKAILLTHGHHDHIGAVRALKDKYNVQTMIHKSDAPMLTDPVKNLSALFSGAAVSPPADKTLQDGDTLLIAGLEIGVLHTPGHSAGSVCFLIGNRLFSGDTLFAGSIGRTDFPDSSWEQMQRSLTVLYNLPGDYTVLPGHGPASTLADERRHNPWMKG